MKTKIAGYAMAFFLGTLCSGSAVFAADHYVQAVEVPSTVSVGDKTVSNEAALSYGGTTYLSSNAVDSALKAVGVTFQTTGANLTINSSFTRSHRWAGKTPSVTTETQNNLTIRVDDAEYTSDGVVLIHLSARNHSHSNMTIDDQLSETLTQGTTHLHAIQGVTGVQLFPDSLADGGEAHATLMFAGGDPNGGPLTFTLPVVSDKYDQTWFVFKFVPHKQTI